jgi:hypothetical protein
MLRYANVRFISLVEAYDEITRSLNRAFALPSLKAYAATLSIRGLLTKAVEMFVGSRGMTK